MDYILNKITGVKLDAIKKQLEIDAERHAKNGMYLEHLWKNTDNLNEIFFLFRVDDMSRCKRLMKNVHEDARKENPEVKIPENIFLEEV